jgi:hypothetical protein
VQRKQQDRLTALHPLDTTIIPTYFGSAITFPHPSSLVVGLNFNPKPKRTFSQKFTLTLTQRTPSASSLASWLVKRFYT